MEEVELNCPFCGESISLAVDASLAEQEYIEDCSVCCRPIEIQVSCENGAVVSIDCDRS